MFEIIVNGVKTDVTSEIQLLIKVLIEFINNTACDWSKREDWENESACKQARALFTTIAFLMNYEPDTANGHGLLLNIYANSGLDKMWSINHLIYSCGSCSHNLGCYYNETHLPSLWKYI